MGISSDPLYVLTRVCVYEDSQLLRCYYFQSILMQNKIYSTSVDTVTSIVVKRMRKKWEYLKF